MLTPQQTADPVGSASALWDLTQRQCPQQRGAAQRPLSLPSAPLPLPLTSGHTVSLPGHARKTQQPALPLKPAVAPRGRGGKRATLMALCEVSPTALQGLTRTSWSPVTITCKEGNVGPHKARRHEASAGQPNAAGEDELHPWVGGVVCAFPERRTPWGPRWDAASSHRLRTGCSVSTLYRDASGHLRRMGEGMSPKVPRSGGLHRKTWDGETGSRGVLWSSVAPSPSSAPVISPRKPSRQMWTEPSETCGVRGLAPHRQQTSLA